MKLFDKTIAMIRNLKIALNIPDNVIDLENILYSIKYTLDDKSPEKARNFTSLGIEFIIQFGTNQCNIALQIWLSTNLIFHSAYVRYNVKNVARDKSR